MSGNESKIQWRRFLAGDDKAYDWLYNQYVQALYAYGLHFTADGEAVRDCIQDLFVHLYKNRQNLVVPEQVKVYLMVALKNFLLKFLSRDRMYARETEVFSLSCLSETTVEDDYIENEDHLRRQTFVEQCLETLTPRQREIIYYRFIRELDWDDICSLMAINYQSAQNLTQRALKKIRDCFADGHRPSE